MKKRFNAELAAAKESKRLLEFDFKKHFKRVLGLYAIGLLYILTEKKLNSNNIGILVREAYLIFRHIDDVLDGDLEISQNPKDYVLMLKEIVVGANDSKKPASTSFPQGIELMLTHSIQELEKRSLPTDNIKKLYELAIDAMLFDYQRINSKSFMSSKDLDNYYYETFAHVLNLMFVGLESRLRISPANLQDLALAQGHIYSIRDLEKDWNTGIYNIPMEVLKDAGIVRPVSFKAIKSSPVIQRWIESELKIYKTKVLKLKEEIAKSGEKFTIITTNFSLLDHMLKTIAKLEGKE